MAITLATIARVTYDVDRAYLDTIAHPDAQPAWGSAETWRVNLWRRQVQVFVRDNPGNSFDAWSPWRDELAVGGWTQGAVIDGTAKTHPLLADSWNDLTDAQKKQHNLFASVMVGLSDGWAQSIVDDLTTEAI